MWRSADQPEHECVFAALALWDYLAAQEHGVVLNAHVIDAVDT
jgi:hypothetical protein